MKKIFFVIALAVSGMYVANAQVDGKAIGLRFGYGFEASYQHALGNANRLELDLGMNPGDGYLGISLTGIYHWVFDLSALTKGFNWYVGAGANTAQWNYREVNGVKKSSDFALGVAGQAGIEYNFEVPLQMSLDYRPILYFLPSTAGGWNSICLAIRYRF
ncbi:MAG: porin family protein [Prevotellaceae bacterium]|jgi:hypothetical protein|nr:porin family protein [Prevotellaceae bacterium]